MTELKTLKDLECSDHDEYSCCSNRKEGESPHAVNIDELKQEAIKWVKSLNENRIPDFYPMRGAFKDGALIFIKEFFNLTEEDLISIDVNEVIDLNSIKKRKLERKQK